MALYLPTKHLAIDVVDDPCSAPVDRGAFPGLTVIRVTCEELAELAPWIRGEETRLSGGRSLSALMRNAREGCKAA